METNSRFETEAHLAGSCRLSAGPDVRKARISGPSPRTLLFTGFEPFNDFTGNSSWEAVSCLPDELPGMCIRKVCLPVEYRSVRVLLLEYLTEMKPDAVIMVGQAGGRAAITLEKVAINWMDAEIPDGANCQFSGVPINPAGKTAYFATLPIKRMRRAMMDQGIPAEISYSAGTYVCNSSMYHLMELIEMHSPKTLGGFVHVPYLCQQAAALHPVAPSLSLDTIVDGLITIAKISFVYRGEDIEDPAGVTC